MSETTRLDSGSPPSDLPLILLGSDPKEELALLKDVPPYSGRIDIELSGLRKHSSFKGNPFLYDPNEYIKAFNALPIWMRNFQDKFVDPKAPVENEKVQMKQFELRDEFGAFSGLIEKEAITLLLYRVLIERRILDDITDILVICNYALSEETSVALRAKGPSASALRYELSDDGSEVFVPGPYQVSAQRIFTTDFNSLAEGFFKEYSAIASFGGGKVLSSEEHIRIRDAYVRESQPPLFEMPSIE